MTERTIRMLRELDKRAQPVFEQFLNLVDENLGETQYNLFEGRRSVATQRAYFAQGRESFEEVNRLRAAAGLWLYTNPNAQLRIITWTMQSKHIDGLAIDVLPVDGRGNPTWDLAHFRREFEIIRNCGRSVGLICGADWAATPDWPHYEIR